MTVTRPLDGRSWPGAVAPIVGEGARFIAVGAGATVVSTLVFNALLHGPGVGLGPATGRPLTAFVVANAVGMVLSYLGARLWAFRGRQATGPLQGVVGFVAVNVLSWAAPLTCLAVSRYGLGLTSALADNLAANVIGLGLGMALRFWALRRSVFTEAAADGDRQLPRHEKE